MSRYRRNYSGQVYFFTVVTHQRQPILTSDFARRALREAITQTKDDLPFNVLAWVLLPDHLHTVWDFPASDTDFSTRWRRIKTAFTKRWVRERGIAVSGSASRQVRGEKGVWQRRFFEHTCRDEQDLQRCIDYVHVNPLKHKLVDRVADWPWSTFHRFVRDGHYPKDWGSSDLWYGDEFRFFE